MEPMIDLDDDTEHRKYRRKKEMFSHINQLLNHDDEEQAFFLFMEDINYESAKQIIEWILHCNFAEKKYDLLNLIICSPGGDTRSAFAVIDVMRGSRIPIRTIGLGQISSGGLMIFMAGKKGERILTPNTAILSHQYSWGSEGKEHELLAQVKEMDLTTKRMLAHYKKFTKLKKEDDIRKYLLPPHDVYLSAEEALDLGICDVIKELK